MLKRHEAAALIEAMLADRNGGAKSGGGQWHFGRQELRNLMDAIYGGPPRTDAEKIGWKYRNAVKVDENGDPDESAMLAVMVVELANRVGYAATTVKDGDAVVATILTNKGEPAYVRVERDCTDEEIMRRLRVARRAASPIA